MTAFLVVLGLVALVVAITLGVVYRAKVVPVLKWLGSVPAVLALIIATTVLMFSMLLSASLGVFVLMISVIFEGIGMLRQKPSKLADVIQKPSEWLFAITGKLGKALFAVSDASESIIDIFIAPLVWLIKKS
jgi:DNA-binding LytR/AlgR family response regulator